MKPDAQRIAIAEACGFVCTGTDASGKPVWTRDNWTWIQAQMLPDYLNDLNAMHEAEKTTFNNSDLWISFIDYLCDATGAINCSMVDALIITNHATAAQRAEAFLRAIGRWVES
jgi:hypothetical protein